MQLRRRRAGWPGYATRADAIEYLASVCDGAIRRDGHGFSSDHVAVGHSLARRARKGWTADEHHDALVLVRIYQRQLVAAGFDVPSIVRGTKPRRCSVRRLTKLHPCWLADPTGVWAWRWWNGVRWTQHVVSAAASAQVAGSSASAPTGRWE